MPCSASFTRTLVLRNWFVRSAIAWLDPSTNEALTDSSQIHRAALLAESRIVERLARRRLAASGRFPGGGPIRRQRRGRARPLLWRSHPVPKCVPHKLGGTAS